MVELVRKAKRGNRDAFSKLYQMNQIDIYRIAFVYVKNRDDALDIVQETAYRSFKYIKKLKDPDKFKTWLLKIAVHSSLDLIRKGKNIVPMDHEYEPISYEEVNETIPLSLTLKDLIELLNVEEKGVILLRFYQDFSIQQIADTLDMPLGTVKTILYRAIRKLQQEWKEDEIHG